MEYEIGADESITTAVIRTVSDLENRDPRSLRPLAEVLDPDALNSLFDSISDGNSKPNCRLSFVYSKCRVTVDDGEYLALQQLDPENQ